MWNKELLSGGNINILSKKAETGTDALKTCWVRDESNIIIKKN